MPMSMEVKVNEHVCEGQFLGQNLIWSSEPPHEEQIIYLFYRWN